MIGRRLKTYMGCDMETESEKYLRIIQEFVPHSASYCVQDLHKVIMREVELKNAALKRSEENAADYRRMVV